MENSKKFYIGGGIARNAFLYTFPIILEYCRLKKIKTIILSNDLKQVVNDKIFKDKIKNFIFIDEKEILPFYYKKNFLIFLTFLIKSLLLFFKVNKKNILNKKKKIIKN